MHFILIKPVLSDHLLLKTGLTVSILMSFKLICVRFPYVHHSYVPFLLNGYGLTVFNMASLSTIFQLYW